MFFGEAVVWLVFVGLLIFSLLMMSLKTKIFFGGKFRWFLSGAVVWQSYVMDYEPCVIVVSKIDDKHSEFSIPKYIFASPWLVKAGNFPC